MRRCSEGWLLAVVGVAGCGSCQHGSPSELAVEGPTPYVRCLMMDAPDDGVARAGSLALRRGERSLRIDGAPETVRLAAFAGPGPSEAPLEGALAAVRALEPHVVLLLGGLGDTRATSERTLAALATLEVPVLVLAGGRDDAVVWEAAWRALPEPARGRVVDITPLRSVRLGARELVPLAGAPGGRYARTDTACGHGAEDLEAVSAGLAPREGARWLVSWAAPSGWAAGPEGADAGDPALATLAREGAMEGGLFAFPAAGATGAGRHAVRPLVGPVLEEPDGRRLDPGPSLLLLGPAALEIAD